MTFSRRLGTVVLLIAVLVSACTAGVPTAQPTGLPTPQAESVRAYLDGLDRAGQLSAAISVSVEGRTFAAAYGSADPATKTQNTIDTRFRIGSVSKQLTAAARPAAPGARPAPAHGSVV